MNGKLSNIFPNIIIQNDVDAFHFCKTHSISVFLVEVEGSYQIGVVGALHLYEEFDPLFNKKSRDCKTSIDKPLRFNEFWSDKGLVFPQCDCTVPSQTQPSKQYTHRNHPAPSTRTPPAQVI